MSSPLNVIVIEDDALLRTDLRLCLEEHGFACDDFSSSEQASAAASFAQADIVLVDLSLPGEDGIDFIKRLREQKPNIGCIIVSGRTDVRNRIEGYSSGADVFLSKPVNHVELISAIEAVARRLKPRTEDSVATIDRMRLTVRGPDQMVRLTHEEASLLIAMRQAGTQGLSREAIAKIFGLSAEAAASGAMEVRLTKLRKKLVSAGLQAPVIRSLRGRGYVLCEALAVTDS